MNPKNLVLSASLTLNFVVLVALSFWLKSRYEAPLVSPMQVRQMIKERSWNSGSAWYLVKREPGVLVIEYQLGFYDFRRYSLPTKLFKLSDTASTADLPFQLSYDGCDVLSSSVSGEFLECIKFRDLSP